MIPITYTIQSTETAHVPPRDRVMIFWQMAALFVCVLLTRLFLLDAGYGTNANARKIAEVTQRWHETGRYEVARPPGSPPYEFLCSILSPGGPWVLNLVSAIGSAVAAVLFAQLARRGGVAWPAWCALVMIMVPVLFILSVSTGPQLPALALGLGALLAATSGHAVAMGLLLGLAVGTRLSSVIYFLPAALLLLGCRRFSIQGNGIRLGLAALVALITAAVCFIPTWQVHGANMLGSIRLPPAAGETPLASSMPFPGLTGLALGVAMVGMIARVILLRNVPAGRRPRLDPFVVAAMLILLFSALAIYEFFPREILYPLAALPALAFFIAVWTDHRFLWLVALLIVLAPWMGFDGYHPVRGPLLLDREKRLEQLSQPSALQIPIEKDAHLLKQIALSPFPSRVPRLFDHFQ